MKRLRWVLLGLAASAIGACQAFGGLGGLEFKGKSTSGLAGGGGGSNAGGQSGQGASDFGGSGGVATTTTTTTSGNGAGTSSSSSSGGSGLDPNLALPDPGGMPCTNYGDECANEEVCRIASAHGGRCEGCTECGNLNAVCTTGEDCDILFECYKNHCTNFCTLGSSNCGPPMNCVNVGNDTDGVCWPVP